MCTPPSVHLENLAVKLFLVRHSIAEPRMTTDFERRLTQEGVLKAERLVRHLNTKQIQPKVIVHSPLIRSQQTAQIFQSNFPNLPCIELPEVLHADASLLQLIGSAGWQDPLIIGHNPSISALASGLTGDDTLLDFHTCSFAAFEIDKLPPLQSQLIHWLPTPPQVP